MATYVPAKKNTAYTFYVGLTSQADGRVLQANPTLAAGDVKVAIDDGAPANLGTLPVVDADFTKRVKVVMTAAEMNGDNITIIFSDATGAEWADLIVNIQTSATQIDGIAGAVADEVVSEAAHTTANSIGLLLRKVAYILGHTKMKITDLTGDIQVRNAADSGDAWTGNVADDSTTTVRTALT